MILWTQEHAVTLIPALLGMLVLTAVLRAAIGKKDRKIRMLPLQILASILVVLEIGKQALSIMRGYDLYHLPFHFCSLFIFALPLMAFYRGKYQEAVCGVTTVLCGSVFLILLIYPVLIYSDGNILAFFTDYFSFHTVVFHNIVMLAFLLILGLDLCPAFRKGAFTTVMLVMTVFCAVAASMAYLLQTNYANFYTCNIPVFETIRLALLPVLGRIITQLVYVFLVALVNNSFVAMVFVLCRFLHRRIPAATQRVPHR